MSLQLEYTSDLASGVYGAIESRRDLGGVGKAKETSRLLDLVLKPKGTKETKGTRPVGPFWRFGGDSVRFSGRQLSRGDPGGRLKQESRYP